MKAFKYSLLFLFCFASHLLSQALEIEWQKSYGGEKDEAAYFTCQTNDGGYICAGYTQSIGAGQSDVWLLRINSSGDTLWTKTYGGTNYDWIQYFLPTSDGNFLISVRSYSFGSGGADMWIFKIDPYGEVIFSKLFGTPADDWSGSIVETADNGFIVAGFTTGLGAGSRDGWILRLNSIGDTLWTKTYGGEQSDSFYGVAITGDEGFLFAGRTESFGNGSTDVWIIKTDQYGDTVWTKTFGGIDSDFASRVIITDDGEIMVLAETQSFGGGLSDFCLINYDDSGNVNWFQTYGSNMSERPFSFRMISPDEYIIAGMKLSDPPIYDNGLLIKANATGDRLWNQEIGGAFDDGIMDINRTSDGGFIISGMTYKSETSDSDLWLVKMKPEIPVRIEDNERTIDFCLSQNYPNPFNPSTLISWQLADGSKVNLKIFDVLGREIVTLVDEYQNAGIHHSTFSTQHYSMPSGVYFYQLSAGEFRTTKKMILTK